MTEAPVAGLVLGLTCALLGPFVWWLTRLAATGGLRRNVWAGIRTSRTLRSDEDWVTGQRAAAPWALRTAVATDAVGVLTVVLALVGATEPLT